MRCRHPGLGRQIGIFGSPAIAALDIILEGKDCLIASRWHAHFF